MTIETFPLNTPPSNVDVLIVGGGPAGSYAASVLALEGISVVVLEASKFPRYHIGESLLPSVRNYLRFVGAEKKVIEHGFTRKPGGAIRFNHGKPEAYTDFVAIGQENSSWNVVRSEFDELLLNHARSCGAAVFEQTKATAVNFDGGDSSKRPISVSWACTPPSRSQVVSKDRSDNVIRGTTRFKYLVDTSGRAGIMSTKYLNNRYFNQALKNIATWGYWRNAGTYGVGTTREGAPYFEALLDESGWAWFIPINNGTTSVGFVRNQKMHNEGKEFNRTDNNTLPFGLSAVPNPSESTTVARYISMFKLAPGIVKLITEQGSLVEGSIRSASDYSYSAPTYAGPGFRIAGDAGAFIDPFFSSGVHLALTSALSAAASVSASIRGDCTEEEAARWHTTRFSTSYTRFQLVVLSAYKQLRAQNMNILTDIDEENYDRAFAFLRPVIQGNAEMGVRLYERELQESLDFCVKLFSATSPESHAQLSSNPRIGQELLDLTAPVMAPQVLEEALSVASESESRNGEKDRSESFEERRRKEETRMALEKINARRVLNPEYSVNGFEAEAFDGFSIRMERGRLGLKHASDL
ncbi:hypothetical protein GYMLUDRAFT_225434 [Collybiopsis luxurians FD-317 M1]|uniref:FAD-binding domain-containing protein n=1 Tax=Collybiopsis luxurians FD-317 M1 TaxID=944289 RepID=A0A0D0CQB0_9AGAR|nr:hypothetical protein GYMLUDRAFT_225434 [Collybiopsis luxurians FD-317 M1]